MPSIIIRPLTLALVCSCMAGSNAAYGPKAPAEGCYIGVQLSGANESLSQMNGNTKINHAIAGMFVQIPRISQWDSDKYLKYFIEESTAAGAIPMFTIELNSTMNFATYDFTGDVKSLARLFKSPSTPIFVRFLHEMNGFWYNWGQKPSEYKYIFSQSAQIMHKIAPNVAMVWAPDNNFHHQYPYRQVMRSNPYFSELDTNTDGLVDGSDDAFGPYYPGDEYVDWIGITSLNWGFNQHGMIANNIVPSTGLLSDLVSTFLEWVNSTKCAKPIMLSETSSYYSASSGSGRNINIKRAWLQELSTVSLLRPNISAVLWFESKRLENASHTVVDWRASSDSNISAFYHDIVSQSFIQGSPHTQITPWWTFALVLLLTFAGLGLLTLLIARVKVYASGKRNASSKALAILSLCFCGWSYYLRLTTTAGLPSICAVLLLVLDMLTLPLTVSGVVLICMYGSGSYRVNAQPREIASGKKELNLKEDAENLSSPTAFEREVVDHEQKQEPKMCSVDVFVACYKEDFDIIRNTVVACTRMRVPDNIHDFRVHLLDDGGREERRHMCEEVGAVYICRADRGRAAKAGNLNNGLRVTSGDLVVFFDADMAPTPDALQILSSVLLEAPDEVVLVQTPQRFYDLQKCDLFISRCVTFYEKMMIVLAEHGATPFVGTGAIFMREALIDIGGFQEGMATEDTATSAALHLKGYRSIYYPFPIAFGTSPQTYGQVLAQRMRWTWGTYQALHRLFRRLLWSSQVPFAAKVWWFNSMMWVGITPLIQVVLLLVACAILAHQEILPESNLARFSFIYLILMQLPWITFMPVESSVNVWALFSDYFVVTAYYLPLHSAKCTYLLFLWVVYGHKRHFASAGEIRGVKREYLIVMGIMGLIGCVLVLTGLYGVISYSVPGLATINGQLIISLIVMLKGCYSLGMFFISLFPFRQYAHIDLESPRDINNLVSRTRKLGFIVVPVLVEWSLIFVLCLLSLVDYLGYGFSI